MVYKFNLGLHKTQQVVYDDPHKHKVIAAGKGWGKTDLVTKSSAGLAMTKPNSNGAVIAPFAKQANYDYKLIKKHIPAHLIADSSERWMTFSLLNKAEVMMGSADNPEGLRGFAWDWVIVDEAAFMDPEVLYIVDSQVGKRDGVGWYISTPNGKGIFYELYCREQQDSEYKSFHYTTYDNPHYPIAAIERMKKTMPFNVFRQEVLAEFIDGGTVFPRLMEVLTALPRDPQPGHTYVAGIDLASSLDFACIKIFDVEDHHEVFTTRFNKRNWEATRTTIYVVCKRYNNALAVIDKTGVGSAVVEDLQKMTAAYPGAPDQGHLVIVPIVFSVKSKPELFSNYMVAMENFMIHLLNDPVTKAEHEDIVSEKTLTGYTKYHAPKGKHEDTVIAAALGSWGLEKIAGTGNICGPYHDEDPEKVNKKPIDPSMQIDADAIIAAKESRQIAGFHGADDDLDIIRDYKD